MRAILCEPPRLSWSLLLLCSLLSTAQAADSPLSLAEAQQIALSHSNQLAGQDAAIRAAIHRAEEAKHYPDPILSVGLENVPIDSSDRFSLSRDFMTMKKLGISQELTRSGKLDLRHQRFEQASNVTQAEQSVTRLNIMQQTARAWLERYELESMLRLVQQQKTETDLAITAAKASYRGGVGSQSEWLTASSEKFLLEDRESELLRRVSVAKIALQRWLGTAQSNSALGAKPDINQISFAISAETKAENSAKTSAWDKYLYHHPNIIVVDQRIELAQTEVDLAKAETKPDWTVSASYANRGPAYSDMASIGISVPLQWNRSHRQNQEIAAKQAEVEQAEDERQDMLREHRANIQSTIAGWQTSRERRDRYQSDLMPLADVRISATLAAYRGGKATLADVLAARRNRLDLQLQALSLDLDVALQWADLTFLFAHTDPNSPSQSQASARDGDH
jgi:outer membrane protein TolC